MLITKIGYLAIISRSYQPKIRIYYVNFQLSINLLVNEEISNLIFWLRLVFNRKISTFAAH